jgi:hypothetical protein
MAISFSQGCSKRDVSAYQPETFYQVFMRVMKYSSTGLVSSLGIENVDPFPSACVVDGVCQKETLPLFQHPPAK